MRICRLVSSINEILMMVMIDLI